jgi:putative flippase GtrA
VGERKMKVKIRGSLLIIQGSKFLLVGILNAIIGLGVIYTTYNLLDMDYKLSNVLGYGCGIVNSFIWNRRWTFRSKKDPKPQVLLFFLMFGVSYGLNLGATVLFVEVIRIPPNIAQLVGIFFYTTSNFFGNKFVTFR